MATILVLQPEVDTYIRRWKKSTVDGERFSSFFEQRRRLLNRETRHFVYAASVPLQQSVSGISNTISPTTQTSRILEGIVWRTQIEEVDRPAISISLKRGMCTRRRSFTTPVFSICSFLLFCTCAATLLVARDLSFSLPCLLCVRVKIGLVNVYFPGWWNPGMENLGITEVDSRTKGGRCIMSPRR